MQQWASALKNPLVVCEAGGGYERNLLAFCWEHKIPVCLVNPMRVRAFAISEGIKAKTDTIDAQVLLRFAKEKALAAMPVPEPKKVELMALMDRRGQLTEQLAREKNRAQKSHAFIQPSINKMIGFVEKEIAAIGKKIDAIIESDAQMKTKVDIIQSVKGLGPATAWTIITYLGETDRLSRNQAVALAGPAPFNRDSGMRIGKRSLQAGRAKVRCCLYMAACSAAVHNDVIKAYVEGLRARGKSYKMAIVAAMRKLIVHIHSLLKKSQPSPICT